MEDQITTWVGEGLSLQRGCKFLSSEPLPTFRNVFNELTKVSSYIPPFGVIMDLISIFTKKWKSGSREVGGEKESRILLSYEEQFLGRVLSDYRLGTIQDLISNMGEKDAPKSIALLIDQVFDRLKITFPKSPSSFVLQNKILNTTNEELFNLSISDWEYLEVMSSYEDITSKSKNFGSLLSDAEIYVIQNIDVLSSKSQRLSLTMISDIVETHLKSFPLAARQSRPRGENQTNLNDVSSYPIGGYSGMTNQGSIESLVGSELIYMESNSELDLFDVKFSSNELLKFQRDESVISRERREIFFFFSSDLVSERKKDPSLPFQRLVLTMGGVVAIITRLVKWLEGSYLSIHLIFHPLLEGEKSLVSLLLRDLLNKKILTIKTGSRSEIQDLESNSLVDVLEFSSSQKNFSEEENEFLEYFIQIKKEPEMVFSKGVVTSGDCMIDWSRFFAFIAKSLV